MFVSVSVCLRVSAPVIGDYQSGLRESTGVGTRKTVTYAKLRQHYRQTLVVGRCHTDVQIVIPGVTFE